MTAAALSWESSRAAGEDWPGTEGLLDTFCDLARAHPEQMGEFLQLYGIPELCREHGKPALHQLHDLGKAGRHGGEPCEVFLAQGGGVLSVWALREAALGFAAARAGGAALAARGRVSRDDWLHLQGFSGLPPSLAATPGGRSWPEQRVYLAEFLTWLLRASNVRPLALWPVGRSLSVTNEADGLLGALAVLLAREIRRGPIAYQCAVCGQPVDRKRPPRPGEAVYCREPACKREQQRRNQAARRERKAAGA